MSGSTSKHNDLLSELRSAEAETDLRRKLEEKLRKTRDRVAEWRSSGSLSIKTQPKSSVNVVQSVVNVMPSCSSTNLSTKRSEEIERETHSNGPSSYGKVLSSTVTVVCNKPSSSSRSGSATPVYLPPYRRPWRRPPATPSNRGAAKFSYRSSYTGYDQRNDEASPSPERFDAEPEPSVARISPPKDMPEHIRWLHDRWSRYDRNFFTDAANNKSNKTHSKFANVNDAAQTKAYAGDMAEYKRTRSQRSSSNGQQSSASKRHKSSEYQQQQKPSTSKNNHGIGGYASYFDWHHGGNERRDVSAPVMMNFKEFLLSHPTEIEEQETAVALYNNYKLDFKVRAFNDFYKRHHDEEWFMEKYNPVYKAKKEAQRREAVGRRLEIFMNLLVRGWIETHVDYTESRHVRKLLDAACVLLENGTEKDIQTLSDFDYILEEKREESYDVERLINEAAENEFKDAAAKEESTLELDAAKSNRVASSFDDFALTNDGELVDAKEKVEQDKKATELEVMQHAKDYTLYVKSHTQALDGDAPSQDVIDLPDSISSDKTETRYVGEGVFVSHQVSGSRNPNETTLHKSASLCLRNLDPQVTRAELEALCADAHGGFLRLHLSEPDPRNNFCRTAVASFWHNANLMKILWILRGKRVQGKQLMVFEYRDFKKRIELIDGLSADKSVVLRDIQLCKSLIEYLDKRNELWAYEIGGDETCPPKINPLLVNLDQCLAFHLQELIKSGKISVTAAETGVLGTSSTEKGGRKVDRDENLTKILDRLILYLRIVHSVDYYGCTFYEFEDDEPKRISTMHLRGPASRVATPKSLAVYIKEFEERLKLLLPYEAHLADEHVELLGKKYYETEVERYLDDSIVSVLDGMTKCCVCYKRFTTREFARNHVKDKHEDKLEEVHVIVSTYNSYLADPNRPCHVDLS